MKNNGFCSDLLVAKKIMVFVGFQSVQIWIFLCSFSPTIWLLRKSISGKHFFLLFGHRMGPEVPRPNGAHGACGAQWGRSGPQEKNPFSKWAGSRYGKTQPEPDPLPFLSPVLVSHIFSCF